eukprot:5826266-Prymnesium_polylepis.1
MRLFGRAGLLIRRHVAQNAVKLSEHVTLRAVGDLLDPTSRAASHLSRQPGDNLPALVELDAEVNCVLRDHISRQSYASSYTDGSESSCTSGSRRCALAEGCAHALHDVAVLGDPLAYEHRDGSRLRRVCLVDMPYAMRDMSSAYSTWLNDHSELRAALPSPRDIGSIDILRTSASETAPCTTAAVERSEPLSDGARSSCAGGTAPPHIGPPGGIIGGGCG